MQNLTHNELDQITKMQNQLVDELKQIAKMRRIKNYENMSKEALLIVFLKSEQSLAKPYNKEEETEKYPDHDDPNYKGIRNIENVFDEINEDYYKPVKTKSAFIDNYIEYESRGDKDKNLSPQEYLYMIRPYLKDMINNHKAPIFIEKLFESSLQKDQEKLEEKNERQQVCFQYATTAVLNPQNIRNHPEEI